MKYLVIAEQTIFTSDHKSQLEILNKTQDWINESKKNETLDCAYSFAKGGGFFIFNADSHEDLVSKLTDMPMRPFSEINIELICDYNKMLEITTNKFKSLKLT